MKAQTKGQTRIDMTALFNRPSLTDLIRVRSDEEIERERKEIERRRKAYAAAYGKEEERGR